MKEPIISKKYKMWSYLKNGILGTCSLSMSNVIVCKNDVIRISASSRNGFRASKKNIN